MKKRLLSLFLCVMMLLTLVPVTALAQNVGDADTGSEAAAQEPVQPAVPVEDTLPVEEVLSDTESDDAGADEVAISDVIIYGRTVVTIGGPSDREALEGGGYRYNMDMFKRQTRVSIDFSVGESYHGTLAGFEKTYNITVDFKSDQSDENVWQDKENHQFSMVFKRGEETLYTGTIYVYIQNNDVINIAAAAPIPVVEGSDACYTIYNEYTEEEYAEYTHYRFDLYNVGSQEWIVTEKDGTVKTYSTEELDEKYDYIPDSAENDFQDADTRWTADDGETHRLNIDFLGKIYPVDIKVVKPKYEIVSFAYTGEAATIVEGIGMGHGQYYLPDVAYQVTYMDGETKVEKALTGEEIYNLFDGKVTLTYLSSQVYNNLGKSWQVGETHNFYVDLLGKMAIVPATVIANPFDKLELAIPNSASLLPYNMGYFDARILAGADEYTGFTAPKFVLTTKKGQTYNGKTELTGTLQQLSDRLGIALYDNFTLEGDTDVETWEAGASRTFTVTFCGLTCNIVVFRARLPITAIQWSEQNTEELTVTKGYDASGCSNGNFAYSPYIDDALFDITFSESGKSRYDLEQDTYTWTLEQLAAKTGFGVILDTQSQFKGLTPDEDGLVYLTYMLEKDDTYYPEISCKVPVRLMDYDGKVSVESVTYAGDPLRLVNGADGYKSNSVFIYDLDAAISNDRFQLKVTLSNEESFTGTPDDVAGFLAEKLGQSYYVNRDYADDDLQVAAPWNVGETHKLRAYLCGIPFEVPVELVEGTRQTLDEETFPDAKFRAYLEEDFGQDGYVIIEAVTAINCYDEGITSLDGIETFKRLRYLDCSGNRLETLDVSANTALTELYCYDNQLTKLDISENTELRELACYNNQLTELDVSKSVELIKLSCYQNQLSDLNVRNNAELAYLDCDDNQLNALDVSQNTALTVLWCRNCGLTELDVSQNSELDGLVCANNQLTELDLSSNTKLTYLECYGNKLSRLDVSGNTNLCRLDCSDNGMTELYLPGSSPETILSRIAGYFSPATYAEETADTALEYLNCSWNKLTKVDTTTCPALETLICADNDAELTVNVADLSKVSLSTMGTEKVTVKEKGETVPGGPASGKLGMDDAQLTLSNADKTFKTIAVAGAYRFDAVADGTYTLTAEMSGYVTRSETVKVTDGTVSGLENFKLAELGDVNLDGVLDVYDLQRLYEHVTGIDLLAGYAAQVSDVNRDNDTSEKSILDLQRLYDQLVNGSGKSGVNSAMTG